MAKKNKNQIKKEIVALMSKTGWLSFPQLIRALRNAGVETEGENRIELKESGVFVWAGLSKPLSDALVDLLQNEEVVIMPAPLQLLQMDSFPHGVPMVFELQTTPQDNPPLFPAYLQYVYKDEEASTTVVQ